MILMRNINLFLADLVSIVTQTQEPELGKRQKFHFLTQLLKNGTSVFLKIIFVIFADANNCDCDYHPGGCTISKVGL